MAVASFASGPASLPRPVIESILQDVAEWGSSGQSVLALPFTGPDFNEILAGAEQSLRRLLGIPDCYKVLFLQGGAYAHFALLPLNLAGNRSAADYVDTGHWSRRAIAEALPWIEVRLAAQGDGRSLPAPETWRVSEDAAYCHYTSNETADGLQYHCVPDVGRVPLVADMSADLLTRPIPVERFGLIYASAQKNLGAAGLTIVIVREDLLGRTRSGTPAPFDYSRQSMERSKVNTPATFAIAIAARMLAWLEDEGGVDAAEERSRRKCAKLYAQLDEGGFFHSPVVRCDRSRVSIRFHLPTRSLEQMLVEEAQREGILHLAGHPSVGGLRANVYNGIDESAVDTLVRFLADFRRLHG